MSWEGGDATHRAGVSNLLAGFRARACRSMRSACNRISASIDRPGDGTGQREGGRLAGFLDAVVAMGYDLLITEFDVNDAALPAATGARDQGVADYGAPIST